MMMLFPHIFCYSCSNGVKIIENDAKISFSYIYTWKIDL